MEKSLEKPSIDLTDPKDLDIEKLNIICYTNKNTKNILTANMFVFENNQTIKGDYPFLCTNVEYNKEYLENKPLTEKVQIFFNKYEFEKFLLSSKKKSSKKDLVRENIFFMLTVMFPLTFPIQDTVTSYYKNNYLFDWERVFKAVTQDTDYVNLNIDKPSTVIQVVWLDTISKNPTYTELYETIKSYKTKVIDYMTQKSKETVFNVKNKIDETTKLGYFSFVKKMQDLVTERLSRYNNTSADLNVLLEKLSKFEKKIKTQENEVLKSEAITLVADLRGILKNYKSQIGFTVNQEIDGIESLLNAKGNEEKDKPAIRAILQQYQNGELTDAEMKGRFSDYENHGSTWWKLYFIFARLKKNTSEYNNFVQNYVKTKIIDPGSNDSSRYYYYNSESSNENKFNKNLADIDFHFDFMNQMQPFILQQRRSTNPQIAGLFRDEEDRYVVEIDNFLGMFKNKDQKNTEAGVDIVKQSSSSTTKLNEIGEVQSTASTSKDKNTFYEIQLGVAVVGGKITSANREYCKFQAIKLANDHKFLKKYGYDNTDKIYLYPYVEMDENAEQPEINTILNLKTKGGRRRTRQYKRGRRTRKLFNRNFQKKKSKNN